MFKRVPVSSSRIGTPSGQGQGLLVTTPRGPGQAGPGEGQVPGEEQGEGSLSLQQGERVELADAGERASVITRAQ